MNSTHPIISCRQNVTIISYINACHLASVCLNTCSAPFWRKKSYGAHFLLHLPKGAPLIYFEPTTHIPTLSFTAVSILYGMCSNFVETFWCSMKEKIIWFSPSNWAWWVGSRREQQVARLERMQGLIQIIFSTQNILNTKCYWYMPRVKLSTEMFLVLQLTT